MTSCNENIPPAVIRKIMGELRELTQNPPEDIKIVPNEADISEIVAIISGPQDTPYQGGAFRIRLKLGPEFPAQPPKGYFVTKIFHPNVSKTGEICVNTLKKDWKESLGIRHILLTVKCLLIVPNAESALNEEAGRLLLEQYEDYAKRARLWTQIHAKPETCGQSTESLEKSAQNSNESLTNVAIQTENNANSAISEDPQPQKRPQETDKKAVLKKKRNKTLKRL